VLQLYQRFLPARSPSPVPEHPPLVQPVETVLGVAGDDFDTRFLSLSKGAELAVDQRVSRTSWIGEQRFRYASSFVARYSTSENFAPLVG